MTKSLLTTSVLLTLAFPLIVPAQTSRSGLISSSAASRLGLTREWFTQVALDRARGRVTYTSTHVNNSRTHTLFQVVYDRGKLEFSELARDRFGKQLGSMGAVELAAQRIVEICEEMQARNGDGPMKDDLTATKQAAEQVLQNILEFRAEQQTSRKEVEAPSVEEFAAPLFSRAKAAPDLLPRFQRRVIPEITIYVATNQGMVQAIDGETGKTRWAVPVGRANHPNMAPAANDEYVAVVNGSMLEILDSQTGKTVWERRLSHAPGASPAITDETIFVPMVNGHVEMYKLYRMDEKFQPPSYFVSSGQNLLQPLTTPGGSLAWASGRGYLYVAAGDADRLRFRLEANKQIESPPTFAPPDLILVSSTDGYVYCVKELAGTVTWRFSTGQPISQSPIPIGGSVFVVTDNLGLFCVNLENGVEKWWSPRIRRFLSASATRVYCEGDRGQLVVLDLETGGRVGTVNTVGLDLKILNSQTDRLYLGSKTGLIQCLHETALSLPIVHQAEENQQKPKRAKPDEDRKPAAKKPADGGADPFGGGADPFGGGKDPFGGGGADPFGGSGSGGGGGGGSDPFGGGSDPFGGGGGGSKDPFGGGADPFGSP